MLRATAACDFWTSDLQKVVRTCGVLRILTCKCASRHSGVRFLDMGSSKIGPRLWCFVHFDLQMCFAPQWRAILPDRNFQKWSRTEVFCTSACNFSTSELQKVLRHRQFFSIFTSKCASRHSGVPFFTCLLNRYLRTRRFSEATFRTSGTTNH